MATNWYCKQLLLNNGYADADVDTLIMASGEQESRVVAEINEGNIWTVYTGHGGETEWCTGDSPGDFNVTELTNLTKNQNMYTMACGHCCLANDFDYSSQCFGETWAKLANKGGISYFGSVPRTVWDEDDWLQRRYFDAVYSHSLYEVGRFTQWGLYWIENNTSTSYKQYYFEAYHVMNDPSMEIWTDIPEVLVVSYPSEVLQGDVFTVSVSHSGSPVQDALVCIWKEDEIYEIQYTNSSGEASFSIPSSATNGWMYVTVTKHNYKPYAESTYVGLYPPTSLTADAISYRTVKLQWEDRSLYETQYKIERKLGDNGTWVEIGTEEEDAEKLYRLWGITLPEILI
jgi:hypothetical protein